MNPLDDIKNITQSLKDLKKRTIELMKEEESNSIKKPSIQVKSKTKNQEEYKKGTSYSIK